MFNPTEGELHGDIMADFNPSNLPSSGPTCGVSYLAVDSDCRHRNQTKWGLCSSGRRDGNDPGNITEEEEEEEQAASSSPSFSRANGSRHLCGITAIFWR